MSDGEHFDLVAVGETMLTMYRRAGSVLADPFAWDACGAESNVARYCAALGLRSCWISGLGRDLAGTLVSDTIANDGVDTSMVHFRSDAPTGVMLKEAPESGGAVQYYRSDSAASLMTRDVLFRPNWPATKAIHVTGITPALSASCMAMIEVILNDPRGALRSFDVNWRPVLWRDMDASTTLFRLANLADVVFVGLDEAQELWGLDHPEAVMSRLAGPQLLVIKDAEHGAYAATHQGVVFEPSLRGPVAALRGAGDAFAGGFLAGLLGAYSGNGRPKSPPDVFSRGALRRCLRLGQIMAMSSIMAETDVGHLPEAGSIEEMLNSSRERWKSLTLSVKATSDNTNF